MKDKTFGLSGNALKIIALVTMTLDHVGLLLMDNYKPMRLIGRLAFPIFAYMIAEGCRFTKNKRNYFLKIFILGILCQAVYYITEQSLYQGILMTFSVSILISYTVLWAEKIRNEKKKERGLCLAAWLLPAALIAAIAVLCGELPVLPIDLRITFDYGFWGILLPVWIVLGKNRKQKFFLALAGMILVALQQGGIQWASMAALVPLAFYNGQKGKLGLKYLFYIYYPLHMAVIYGLTYIIP